MADDANANLGKVVKKLDDTVIIVTVALSFAAAILFAVVMNYGLFFPPTGSRRNSASTTILNPIVTRLSD